MTLPMWASLCWQVCARTCSFVWRPALAGRVPLLWAWHSFAHTFSSPPHFPFNPAAPTNLGYTETSVVFTKGSAISDNSPSADGDDVVSYAISPALPTGLAFSTSTGVISGTPSVLSTTATAYTVTATNSGGDDTVDVTITVNDGE